MLSENLWPLGSVVKSSWNSISFSAVPDDLTDKIADNHVLVMQGVGNYIWFQINNNLIVVARVYSVEEDEQPYLKDEPNSHFRKRYIFNSEPIGELKNNQIYQAGVSVIPMVGKDAYFATPAMLSIIFNVDLKRPAITLGSLVNYSQIIPKFPIDDLLTGHMAILGNTGSGKSTTMRALLKQLYDREEEFREGSKFFIFDIHDDYSHLDIPSIKVIDNHIPLNKLSIDDWDAILLPSEKTQKPILQLGLKLSRLNSSGWIKLRALLIYKIFMNDTLQSITKYQKIYDYITPILSSLDANTQDVWKRYSPKYGNFSAESDQEQFVQGILTLATCSQIDLLVNDEKNFKPLIPDFKTVLSGIEAAFSIEEAEGNLQIRGNSEALLTRMRNLKSKYGTTLLSSHGHDIDITTTNMFALFDVSDLDDIALKLFSNYIARLTLAHQQIKRAELASRGKISDMSPTYLVLDEAHRYILNDPDHNSIFEKISREGRKFGEYLVILSQRPSELSTVVLSQAKTFVMHRIQNIIDINFIRDNVPAVTLNDVHRLPLLPIGAALIANGHDSSFELQIDDLGQKNISNSVGLLK